MAGLICAIPLVVWYALIYTPGDEATWRAFMRLGAGARDFSGPIVASFQGDRRHAAGHAARRGVSDCFGFREQRFVRPQFMAALACYAFVAAVLILFWPSGSTPRYYLPMVLPLCVFGGLATISSA